MLQRVGRTQTAVPILASTVAIPDQQTALWPVFPRPEFETHTLAIQPESTVSILWEFCHRFQRCAAFQGHRFVRYTKQELLSKAC